MASAVTGKRDWMYLDANAIAPVTANRVAEIVEDAGARYVDGGIVGPPPVIPGRMRLYLSGQAAAEARQALVTDRFEVRVIDEHLTSASALKLAYAAWTKGSAALLLAVRAAAIGSGVDETLLEEWRTSQPESRGSLGTCSTIRPGEGLALVGRNGGNRVHVRGARSTFGLSHRGRRSLRGSEQVRLTERSRHHAADLCRVSVTPDHEHHRPAKVTATDRTRG